MAALDKFNSLDADDMKPWHLHLTVQLFGPDGKPSDSAVAEEWWAAKDRWRLEYTQGADKTVLLKDGAAMFHNEGSKGMPTDVEMLLQHVVHPVYEDDLEGAVPKVEPHQFAQLKTECVMLTQPVKGTGAIPLGLFPTYCEDAAGMLRVTWLSASISIVGNSMGKFQGHAIPIKEGMTHMHTKVAEAHVDKLESVDAAGIDLSHDGLAAGAAGAIARVSSGVMAGRLRNKTRPQYPVEARAKHVSGTVVLHAIIGTDGHIRRLRVVQSPDYTLSIAALGAVEQWTYAPFYTGGVPVSVETTIMLNFNLMW